MDKTLKNILILILFLATLIYIFTSFYVPLSQDEGVFLNISKGVFSGLLPYWDFFDHKPPLIYLLLMLPSKLLVNNFIGYRILVLFINLLASFFVYKIAEKYRNNIGLLAAVSYLFLVYIFEGYYLISEPFLALFLSSAFYLIAKNKNKSNYIFSGVLVSAAVLTKQPALISASVLMLFAYRNKSDLRNFIYFILGFIFPLLLLFFWLALNGIFNIFVDQALISNFYYPAMSLNIVLAKLLGLIYQSWYFWFFIIYFVLVFRSKDKVILSLLVFLPIMTYLVRDYSHYWIQSLPFAAICFSFGLDDFASKYRKIVVVISIIFLLTSISTVKWFYWMYKNTWRFQSIEQREAASYINSLDGDYLFAENRFTPFYFSSSKKNVSKFLYITEITDHYEASKDIINKLDSRDKLIILWPNDGKIFSKEIEDKIKTSFNKIKVYDKLNMDIYINY